MFSLPEIAAAIEALPVASLILDGEVIALEPSGRPRPFQETMRRFGRKLDVAQAKAAIPMSLFAFDCLHAAGEDLSIVRSRSGSRDSRRICRQN